MSSFRQPFPSTTNAYANPYAALPYRLEPLEPELVPKPKPVPVAQNSKKQPLARDTGRIKKRKAAGTAKKKRLTPLLPVHASELQAIWQAYPRIPTVLSRREWAAARNLEPAVVHRWFSRQKGENRSLPEYDLAVGTPPDVDAVQVKLEESIVKPEPLDSFLPWERPISAAPTLVNPVQSRKPSGRSQRSAIFISDDDCLPMDHFAFLPDESPEATSKWLQGLSGCSFVPVDKPLAPASLSAASGPNLAFSSGAPKTIQPSAVHFFQSSQTSPISSRSAVPPRQLTAPAPAPLAYTGPLPPPLAHPPAHPLQTAFHSSNDFVPPWLLPPPDCVMIPRALYAALAKTARLYAPEIFQQFPLYDFLNLA